jgi:hypothetical protein
MLALLIIIGVTVVLGLGFYFTRGAGGRLDLSPRTRAADTIGPLGDNAVQEWSDEDQRHD